MKPMGLRSTPLLSYHDIKTNEIDLYADAWGIYPEFDDVIALLNELNPVPEKRLIRRLIKRVRQQN